MVFEFRKNPAELKARMGEWDTQTPDELYPHQDRLVTKVPYKYNVCQRCELNEQYLDLNL